MRNDTAQAAPMMLIFLLVVVVAALAVTDAASIVVAHARAQTAADASSLAAVVGEFKYSGQDSAESRAASFATANGATLVVCDCPPFRGEATVVVEVVPRAKILKFVSAVRATASARLDLNRVFQPAGVDPWLSYRSPTTENGQTG